MTGGGRGVPAGATGIAVEKGYFRGGGMEVQLEKIESAAPAMAYLASNRLQVVEGGLAAGYWNALSQGLPTIMPLERGSGPLYPDLLVRPAPAGQFKTAADPTGPPGPLVRPA